MFEDVLKEFVSSKTCDCSGWRYAVAVANDADSRALIERSRQDVMRGLWPSGPSDFIATHDAWVLVYLDSQRESLGAYWLEMHDPYLLEDPVWLLAWRRAPRVQVPTTVKWIPLD